MWKSIDLVKWLNGSDFLLILVIALACLELLLIYKKELPVVPWTTYVKEEAKPL